MYFLFLIIPYSLLFRNNICLVSGPYLELGSLSRYIYFIQKFIDLPYPPINTTIILTTLFGNATSRSPGLSVCRSVGLLVCIVICHNFLKGGGLFISMLLRSTCLIFLSLCRFISLSHTLSSPWFSKDMAFLPINLPL